MASSPVLGNKYPGHRRSTAVSTISVPSTTRNNTFSSKRNELHLKINVHAANSTRTLDFLPRCIQGDTHSAASSLGSAARDRGLNGVGPVYSSPIDSRRVLMRARGTTCDLPSTTRSNERRRAVSSLPQVSRGQKLKNFFHFFRHAILISHIDEDVRQSQASTTVTKKIVRFGPDIFLIPTAMADIDPK